MKKIILICVACTLMAGCDYTVPLVKTPDAKIDTALVGSWEKSGSDGNAENLLVLPMSEHEYMVAFPAGSKNAMFARGCIWRSETTILVQLNWFGTIKGKLPEDNRTYQFASYTVDGDSLTVRLLNPDVVTKSVKSSEELVGGIVDNKNDPKLFREEIVFQKVK